MRAAVYCRVSTEDQEREGTSLESQREACLKKASELNFDVDDRDIYIETYSGRTMDRPRLTELRQAVRDGYVQAVVAYCLDRFSRDPVHFIILQEELQKADVALVFAIEDIDNSDMGKLISHIRGYAAKLEAVKIAERTTRGRKMRALSGKLPANSHATLYGYDYRPGKEEGGGIRYVNEDEAAVVRNIYTWCLEGLSSNAITYRLRESGVPTPGKSQFWRRSTILRILNNPAYCGKTYAFTCCYSEPKTTAKSDVKRKRVVMKPKEDWMEIPNATPAIISEDTYNAVRAKLERNKKMAKRNGKHEYLLRGHMICGRCGRSYWADRDVQIRKGIRYEYPFYYCSGTCKATTPIKCTNKRHYASNVDQLVWAEIEKILTQPELVFDELERRNREDKSDSWRTDLERVNTLLANRQKQKERFHKAFAITGDEDLFRRNIAAVQKEVEGLEKERQHLEERLASAENKVDSGRLKEACEMVRSNLQTLSLEEKQLALSVLKIRVIVDGDSLTIQGAIPSLESGIVTTKA